jgi:hypothetical protein
MPTTCITGWIALKAIQTFLYPGVTGLCLENLEIRGTENLAERNKAFVTENER